MNDVDDGDIPRWLKWLFISINRVGFPIVAFILMWYLADIAVQRVVVSVEQNTIVLATVRDTLARIDIKLDLHR